MSDLLELAKMAFIINGPYMREARLIRSAEIKKRKERTAVDVAEVADRQPGRVYFAECGDFIKIGFTISVESRIASLSTGNPLPIRLLLVVKAKREFEREMHKRFAAVRHRGEWFEKHPDLMDLISDLKAQR